MKDVRVKKEMKCGNRHRLLEPESEIPWVKHQQNLREKQQEDNIQLQLMNEALIRETQPHEIRFGNIYFINM